MTPAELQQLDERLTAEGHDPECAAYDDRECSCGVASGVVPVRKPKRVTPPVDPDAITLTGPAAQAYRRYQAASRRLLLAQAEMKTASEEFTAAHQAFADASARVES